LRQIEYWFKHDIDSYVQSVRTAPRELVAAGGVGSDPDRHPRPINDDVLAEAHQQAWSLAVVRAQRSSNAADWAAITVEAQSGAYLGLMQWTSVKYRIPADAVLSSLKEMGHCR
jgi:hypothetical protein